LIIAGSLIRFDVLRERGENMTAEILASADDEFRGTEWEKFANASRAAYLGNQFGEMAYRFERAAQVLVEQWDHVRGHNLDVPIAYLCRHRLELSIKAAWEDANRLGFDGGDPPRDHGLTDLWIPLQKFCEGIGIIHEEDEFVGKFREILAFLDDIDRRSTSFRYPLDDRNSQIVVDIPKLWNAMDVCDTLFFGLDAMMDQYSDYLTEMHRNAC
jgi:hypothetical protein